MTPPNVEQAPLTIDDLDALVTELQKSERLWTPGSAPAAAGVATLKLVELRRRLRTRMLGVDVAVGVTGGLLARIELTAVGDQAELVIARRTPEGRVKTSGHLIRRELLLDPLADTLPDSPIGDVLGQAIGDVAVTLQDWARA